MAERVSIVGYYGAGDYDEKGANIDRCDNGDSEEQHSSL